MMSLTDREKEIALECAKKMLGFQPAHGTLLVEMMGSFLSRIREEQEAVVTILVSDPEDERDGLSCTPKDWRKLLALPPHTKLFTTPPAAPMLNEELLDRYQSLQEDFANINKSCSELVEALKAYDQIVRITISRLIRQYGNDDDEYAIELRGCLKNACEALANHAKRMKEGE